MRFEILANRQQPQPFWWRFVAANNRIIATSGEYYTGKGSAEHGINLVKGTTSVNQYEFYRDTANQWRFRLKALNGQIIAVASEGYHNQGDCVSACQLLVSTNVFTPVHDLT